MKANEISPAFLHILEESVNKAVNEAFTTQKAQAARLTTAQTMATLACSRTTLWRIVKEGKLTPHKGAGRTLTYDTKEVLKLRDSCNEGKWNMEAPPTKEPKIHGTSSDKAEEEKHAHVCTSSVELDNSSEEIVPSSLPKARTRRAKSASKQQDVQSTDKDLESVYNEVLSGRRYIQMPFDILNGIRNDLELKQLSASQVCQIVFYIIDAAMGKVSTTPTASEIPDSLVRVYVNQWLRDRNTLTPDEYVGYIMNNQRHWRAKIGGRYVDVSDTKWAKDLMTEYAKKK